MLLFELALLPVVVYRKKDAYVSKHVFGMVKKALLVQDGDNWDWTNLSRKRGSGFLKLSWLKYVVATYYF